jgi:glucokinase
MILAGDIGGTKTVLALFDPTGAHPRCVHEATFPSAKYASLEEVVSEFRATTTWPTLDGACFGVAGPVHDGVADLTNLPWVLDEAKLRKSLGVAQVKLLNDLAATAYGILFLEPSEFHTLQSAANEKRRGSIAIVAPGTGLGEAILHFDGKRYHAIASEGGHTDFAPCNEDEVALLGELRRSFGPHISYERILSGAGIGSVYVFLRERSRIPEPAWLTAERKEGDPNAVISKVALERRDPICEQAMAMFTSVLGAEAANLALKCLASSVIIAGGIPPKILPLLSNGTFLKAFAAKGRFSNWASGLTVKVALNPRSPLLGAAQYLVSDLVHR